ncbi:putative mitochondrial import protein [Fonsecaea pedrosoi]|nr:putative mitochondrial import protein [Fonsecaea pedrosoi]
MASRQDQSPSPPQDLSASQLTIPSDSEAYSSLSPPSSSPPQSSDNNGTQPVVIYQPPTIWSILRGAAINLVLPFVNGMMLGFGMAAPSILSSHRAWYRNKRRPNPEKKKKQLPGR